MFYVPSNKSKTNESIPNKLVKLVCNSNDIDSTGLSLANIYTNTRFI